MEIEMKMEIEMEMEMKIEVYFVKFVQERCNAIRRPSQRTKRGQDSVKWIGESFGRAISYPLSSILPLDDVTSKTKGGQIKCLSVCLLLVLTA